MAGVNKVILVGRLGRDPQTFTFDDGTKKISFSVATTESYRDRDGNWQDITDWHNVVGYRYLAEKSIAQGDLVYIEGKLKTRKYTDSNQVEKYVTEVLADKIMILLRKNPEGYTEKGAYESGSSAPPQQQKGDTLPGQNEPPAPEPPAAESSGEDDLPF